MPLAFAHRVYLFSVSLISPGAAMMRAGPPANSRMKVRCANRESLRALCLLSSRASASRCRRAHVAAI